MLCNFISEGAQYSYSWFQWLVLASLLLLRRKYPDCTHAYLTSLGNSLGWQHNTSYNMSGCESGTKRFECFTAIDEHSC